MRKILIFGSLPPPVGGVRVFVEKLYKYLVNAGHFVSLCPGKLSFIRYDVGYINFSSPFKRFLASVLAVLFCKRRYLILHSSIFDLDNPFNLFAVYLVNGIITTSGDVVSALDERSYGSRVLYQSGLLYSEFLEGFDSCPISKAGGVTILFYQNNNESVGGRNIYGADLMLDALEYLSERFRIIWIDLSGELAGSLSSYENVEYYCEPVDMDTIYKRTDMLVRPTAFDGTAFMIVEALSYGLRVLCSDVVSRPRGAITFNMTDGKGLAGEIETALCSDFDKDGIERAKSIEEFLEFSGIY